MNRNIEKQVEFHAIFDQPILTLEEDITPERAKLRLNLAIEELKELATAFGLQKSFYDILHSTSDKVVQEWIGEHNTLDVLDTNKLNKPEILDALVDIEVINNGTVLECGMSGVFNNAYMDIHSSNMSKACVTEKEAIDTLDAYKEKGVEAYYKDNGFRFMVYRQFDNKVLKSVNYKPFDSTKYFTNEPEQKKLTDTK